MVVNTVYKISGHKQFVELEDVSTSIDKEFKQVLVFENNMPDDNALRGFLKGSSIGIVLVVDAFEKETFNTFDAIIGSENDLYVLREVSIDNQRAVICLPDNFLTLYNGLQIYHQPKIFKARVVTLSDRAYRGIYEDKSGPKVVNMVEHFFETNHKKAQIKSQIIPDFEEELALILEECRVEKYDLLITTGGTGIGKRDITVETVKKHLDKEIPGIMEMIRMKYGAQKPNALLSRGVAGTMGQTLVYTLPGSVKAVEEYLNEIFTTLDHLFYMLHGIDNH